MLHTAVVQHMKIQQALFWLMTLTNTLHHGRERLHQRESGALLRT
jgi:hypothetical protein